jgi:hypothetical protein
MTRNKLKVCLIVATLIITACNVPNEPNFTTSHTIEAPILNNKTYVFLGDSTGALIDTTAEDMDSLFTVGGDGLITISTEEDFDFGDLNDAIPEIDGSTTSFSSAVGEIELGSFSSGGGDLGSTNFATISGASEPPAGTPIPAGDNSAQPVNIPIGNNTDYFVSATIKSGQLDITVTNELGFDISSMTLTLLASGVQVGSTATFNNLTNGATETGSIAFSDGDALSDLSVDVVIAWDAFTYPATSGDLIINSANGTNLFASSVTANLEPQDFSTSNTSTFSTSEFEFTDASHYAELSGGTISITNLANNMGIGIESATISFPGIRNDDFGAEDSLVVTLPALPANTIGSNINVDLTGYRIYALNNEVEYNIVAATENTQTGPGAGAVTIAETDAIGATVEISSLNLSSALGIVKQQNVLLGDNDLSNDGASEILDAFNDNEAELTIIDGLDELSEQVDGLQFSNPVINITYSTNIGIETTVYGVLVGVDSEGNEVYLSGEAGSPYEVTGTDPIDGLYANGVQLDASNLIKFNISTSPDGNPINDQITFNTTTTNVDDFLNNLPSEIRFVGRAIVNESEAEGMISAPLNFDPSIVVDLPLAFSTDVNSPASVTDTLDMDLGLDEEQTLTEGRIFLTYTNDLPLGVDIDLIFMDENYNQVFTLPNAGDQISMTASPIDAGTRFSTGGTEDAIVINFNEDQLSQISNIAFVELSASMQTTNNESVKIRATDSITLSLSIRAKLETEVK